MNFLIYSIIQGIEWIRNPLTLAQMTINDVFGCDPPSNNREPVPCPEPQVCYYPESVPGGEQNMGSEFFRVANPAEGIPGILFS